jgi:hypothetical protein
MQYSEHVSFLFYGIMHPNKHKSEWDWLRAPIIELVLRIILWLTYIIHWLVYPIFVVCVCLGCLCSINAGWGQSIHSRWKSEAWGRYGKIPLNLWKSNSFDNSQAIEIFLSHSLLRKCNLSSVALSWNELHFSRKCNCAA